MSYCVTDGDEPAKAPEAKKNLWHEPSGIGQIIIANEVPKEDMLQLMTNEWKMSPDLADVFFTWFGGHIRLCYLGVEALRRLGEDFKPLALLDCPGLPDCASDPAARRHPTNMAKQGLPSTTS